MPNMRASREAQLGSQALDAEQPFLDSEPRLEVPETAVHMVYLTIFLDTLAASISTPMMPYYAKSFGVSVSMIGWLYAAWSFSSTVFAPQLGVLADKWGRRPVLLMSLCGAGVANLIQGFAPNFYVFLFGRCFSGVWAAVGATCNIYITDVAPEPILPGYLSKMAAVPMFAIMFGPGLGGGLAKFGLNVPIVVDGVVTLFSCLVVSQYLPETPAFKRMTCRSECKSSGKPAAQIAAVPVPRIINLLGFANFLSGISFSSFLSAFAIFMQARHGFDTLHVGFSFVYNAIIMLLTNIWVVPWLQKRFTKFQVPFLGGLINGIAYFAIVSVNWLPFTFCALAAMAVGSGIKNGSNTLVISSFAHTSNRGKIFGRMMLYTNAGRIVGPIVALHLEQYSSGMAFIFAGAVGLTSASIILLLGMTQVKASSVSLEGEPVRRRSGYGQAWEDEEGSKDDIESLGRFVSDLLSKRHYKWVSRRAEIEKLLQMLLPEMETTDPEAYAKSLTTLQENSRSIGAHQQS